MCTDKGAKGNQRGLSHVQRQPISFCHRGLYPANWCALNPSIYMRRDMSDLGVDSCDINVSPDKRTILLHSENNLIEALKVRMQLRSYEPR
jgi:hypothetical protein